MPNSELIKADINLAKNEIHIAFGNNITQLSLHNCSEESKKLKSNMDKQLQCLTVTEINEQAGLDLVRLNIQIVDGASIFSYAPETEDSTDIFSKIDHLCNTKSQTQKLFLVCSQRLLTQIDDAVSGFSALGQAKDGSKNEMIKIIKTSNGNLFCRWQLHYTMSERLVKDYGSEEGIEKSFGIESLFFITDNDWFCLACNKNLLK